MTTLQRRFLPPIHVLCAFESAARHQSFTAAAAELCLTQSAISRQVRALEEQIGSALFIRERQTVRLTTAGEAYAEEVRATLRRLATATLGFRANPKGGLLNVAILPTFGTRWLAPRLPAFMIEHPGVTLNLTTRLAPFDFQSDQVDAAIHFGQPDWPHARFDFLMKETVVPACSAAFMKAYRISQPRHLLKAPLLHLESRPQAWRQWFMAMGVPSGEVPGMLVDQFAVATQAAIAGLGVALLPRFLIDSELARGDLVVAVDLQMESEDDYYLAWPIARESYPPLQAFRQWIRQEALASKEVGDNQR
ncbi:LysR substrate-binding domain-containing protein [Comamonadaceae bacterium G21597-S1]|nr:LysR substrate-binding domain-containing protein [Comamonadaceae bacterium G21597-S1]